MYNIPFKPITQDISEVERNELIDQLCAALGTQYKHMRKYRSL